MAIAKPATPFSQTEQEHRELRALTKEIRQSLKETPAEAGKEQMRNWGRVSDRILDLRDRLVLHFDQEERAGLTELFDEMQPHIADRSETLRGEHSGLLREMKALYVAMLLHAGGAGAPGTDLRKWTLDVLNHLARHEEKETGLIQRAYLEELGTGD